MRSLAEKLEALLALGGIPKDIVLLVLSGLSLLLSLFAPVPLPLDPAWVAIVLCGLPIVLEAIIGLVTAFDIKADVLVSMALIASVCIGEHFAAGEVAFIMQLGALLEELTVARARAGIEKLVRLTPQTARVLSDGGERVIPAEAVQVGDRLRVLPGETVPVDGIILSGQTSINQAVMTGESLPVDKGPGDQVSSGTVNQFGAFEMEASKVGEDSSVQRMIRLVQSADAGKAKIVGLADRWATWVVVIALTAAVLTWAVSGEIIRAVTILVVFCPCALVLATPTAIMAAIGNATRHGFLVREGDALERLAGVTRITFDKTGTLTYGRPQVTAARSALPGLPNNTLFGLVASAEQLSEHPLGKAVVQSYRQSGGVLSPAADFRMIPGEGVGARVDGKTVLAGNEKLLHAAGITIPDAIRPELDGCLAQGCTLILTAVDGTFAGFLALSDTIRPDHRAARPPGRPAGAAHRGPPERGGGHRRAAGHPGDPRRLPAGRQTALSGGMSERRAEGLHDRGRDQRRPRPEKGQRGHRHGGGGQRHRRRRRRHRAGRRRGKGASPSLRPVPADDDHHQVEPHLLYGPQLSGHCPGHPRRSQPGGGRAGPQCRLRGGHRPLRPAAALALPGAGGRGLIFPHFAPGVILSRKTPPLCGRMGTETNPRGCFSPERRLRT